MDMLSHGGSFDGFDLDTLFVCGCPKFSTLKEG